MTGTEAIAIMRNRINDVAGDVYTDAELLGYLNVTIKSVANMMNGAGVPDNAKRLSVGQDGTAIPSDFGGFLPGMPVYIEDGNIMLHPAMLWDTWISYWSIPADIAQGDSIPLRQPYDASAVNLAVEMALMRTGHDVSPETALHIMLSGAQRAAAAEQGGGQGGVPQRYTQ